MRDAKLLAMAAFMGLIFSLLVTMLFGGQKRHRGVVIMLFRQPLPGRVTFWGLYQVMTRRTLHSCVEGSTSLIVHPSFT